MRVDLQMMRRYFIALLLLVQLVLAMLPVLPAHAAGVGSIAGHVFVDANSNGMAVVAQADAARTYEVTTDAAGLFVLTGLEYGIYDVSASADGKVAQGHTVIEIAEVNAPVLLDLPVYDSVDFNITVKSGRLFLPLLKP
jgi:Carboxypeptidase regulatory-like domain